MKIYELAAIIFYLAVLYAAPAEARNLNLPDPVLTPGETRTVTVTTLCTTSTKLVRNVTPAVSLQVYTAYGMPGGNHTGYCAGIGGCELDHDISLSLGGSNGKKNLFPMPYSGSCNAYDKDKLEFKLYKSMCAGAITMKQAQDAIRGNWIPAYKKYVNKMGC